MINNHILSQVERLHGKLSNILPKREIGVKSILHISDTHGKHLELHDLPMADVVVHSGDFTLDGSEDEAYNFMNWLCDLPHPHKIFIAGNHDLCMYGAPGVEGLPDNVHYLCNTSVTIGGLKFFGMPLFMNDVADGTFSKNIQCIPNDTDVLITHQPAYSICDLADYGNGLEHRGDKDLARRISQLKLMYHLFGHEHDTYGTDRKNSTIYSNAALVDIHFNLVHAPRLLNIDDDITYHFSHIRAED